MKTILIMLLVLFPVLSKKEVRHIKMSDDRRRQIETFLRNIADIESSGGKNFNHPEIKYGMHKGQRAIGRYGLMPNTVMEIVNRMRREGVITPELKYAANQSPEAMKELLEKSPSQEDQLASYLANKVLDRQQGDPEKAAYSWFQGHNLTPEKIEKRGYKEHDYVQKYNKYENLRKQLEEQQAKDEELMKLRVNPSNKGME